MQKSQFLLAAPKSNSGKTTLTIALLRALKKRGKIIQPYKCGPDYIDTQHHKYAGNRHSINLDLFMSSAQYVHKCYQYYLKEADIGVIEGVMGLFDGASGPNGSSAELAKVLDVPVILIVDARSVGFSVAPLLYGFKHYDPELKVKGVIFNNVNKKKHFQILKEACDTVGIEALGYLAHEENNEIPSRHLGLNLGQDMRIDHIFKKLGSQVEKTVNIDRLLEITALQSVEPEPFYTHNASNSGDLRISVAYDDAFNFIYWENIRVLNEMGSVTFFSPIKDKKLPATDFLYIGGGYPELYLLYLRANKSMRESVREYCESGGITYAECGGLMYLGKGIVDEEGDLYSMVDFMDIGTSMLQARLHIGYRILRYGDYEVRGHEFHYSNYNVLNDNIQSLGTITNARDQHVPVKMYRKKNTFASYMHLYWAENPAILNYFLQNKK